MPLITIIIRSLKKLAAAHSTQGSRGLIVMSTAQPKPILNTPLPSQFGQIAWSSRMITGEVLDEPR